MKSLIFLLLSLVCCPLLFADAPEIFPLLNENKEVLIRMQRLHSINLLNGLNLSQAQRHFLVQKLKGIRDSVDELAIEAAAERQGAIKLLADIEKAVRQGKKPKKELGEKVGKLALQLKGKFEKHALIVAQTTGEIYSQLSASQRLVVGRYHECLTPNPFSDDESFVGSAEADELLNGLEKIRALNSVLYFVVSGHIASELAQGMTNFANDLDKDVVREALLEMFKDARSLSEVEWQLQKKRFAVDFLHRFGALRHATTNDKAIKGKIRKFLLNPELIELLRDKTNEEA